MVGGRRLGPGDHLSAARRPAVVVGAAAGLAAWILAAVLLVRTGIPGGLHEPHLRAGDWFAPRLLHRARSFDELAVGFALGGELASLAALAVFARRGAGWAGESGAGPVGTGSMLAMLGLGIAWIATLPFTVAGLWWARDHHVARISYPAYVLQDFLTEASGLAAVAVAVLVAMGLAQRIGRLWPLPGSVALVAISTVLALLGPWLVPDLRVVQDPVLSADARALAAREGVPAARLRVQEVRRQTSAPNAEAVGLGPGDRVILWDTLLDGRFSRREVDAVIGHELGHLAHHDGWRRVGLSALFLIPAAFVVEAATRRRGGMRRPEAVPLALLVVAVLQFVTLPAQNLASRRLEANADWSSLQATHDPAASIALFRRFASTALEDPRPPFWVQAVIGDHPALLDRMAQACAWAAAHPRTLAARCR